MYAKISLHWDNGNKAVEYIVPLKHGEVQMPIDVEGGMVEDDLRCYGFKFAPDLERVEPLLVPE